MMDAINTARHALGLGLTRAEVADHLIARGVSVEDAFLALAAAKVLDADYVCVPERGNRKESCTVTVPWRG
ncbi:MAG: hypothetical protein GTN93_15045 [Anaerolineae bacterium]|nr:hypothetical protein [Anaerolineae bacterium]